MAYIGTDGNLHLSEEDANSGDYTGAFIIDDPYPNPLTYPGGEGMPTVEERLAALEKQVPLQTEGLRRVTEGHYNGAEGSAAIVVALEGGNTTINPQPDPS
jgi:hypothetical protein